MSLIDQNTFEIETILVLFEKKLIASLVLKYLGRRDNFNVQTVSQGESREQEIASVGKLPMRNIILDSWGYDLLLESNLSLADTRLVSIGLSEDQLNSIASIPVCSSAILPQDSSIELAYHALGIAMEEINYVHPCISRPSKSMNLLREKLTAREVDVLRELTAGSSNKAIARNLDISDETVKMYVSRLLAKFEAVNRTVLAIKASNHIAPN